MDIVIAAAIVIAMAAAVIYICKSDRSRKKCMGCSGKYSRASKCGCCCSCSEYSVTESGNEEPQQNS